MLCFMSAVLMNFQILANAPVKIKVKLIETKVEITLAYKKPATIKNLVLYRSTTNLRKVRAINLYAYPITKIVIKDRNKMQKYLDDQVAHNVTYYYMASVVSTEKKTTISNIQSVTIPDIPLKLHGTPSFIIDKKNYFLELNENGKPIKRYPLALGANPMAQKLHQDNSTTPEGAYKIINLQPYATYYKAYNINYPNSTDRIRYNLSLKNKLIARRGNKYPGMGGAIQIHGKGIGNNWTWGCMAMRNNDIDELFAQKSIKRGVKVYIAGENITKKDITKKIRGYSEKEIKRMKQRLIIQGYKLKDLSGKLDAPTRKALGEFQIKNNLPITCEIDRRTLDKLGMLKPPIHSSRPANQTKSQD